MSSRRKFLATVASLLAPVTACFGSRNDCSQNLPEPVDDSLADAIENLENIMMIQLSDGNWNYDPYMHGLANGLICAHSVITGCDPNYVDAPEDGFSAPEKPA